MPHLSEDKCPKCGWKAPAGLLKCPFCKTYIRKPGSSSSTELKIPDAADLARWAKDGPPDEGSEGAKPAGPGAPPGPSSS